VARLKMSTVRPSTASAVRLLKVFTVVMRRSPRKTASYHHHPRRRAGTDGSLDGVGGPPWFSEYGFQQTRGFRALKTWMVLKHVGLDGLKGAIEGNLELARYFAE